MGIEIEPLTNEIHSTKAEENYDSLTGTFSIPHRNDFETVSRFAFALDEKGIVFIDDEGTAQKIINEIHQTKKWRLPGLERFPELQARISSETNDNLIAYMRRLGLEGYCQEPEAATEEMIPAFDGTGVAAPPQF